MGYILKQYDTELLRFDMTRNIDGINITLHSVNDNEKHLLPLDLQPDEKSLVKWLKNRTIPSNRAYVTNFLAKLGLSEKDTIGILDICKGLSLNDSYWVVDEKYTGNFADNNLFKNPFSRTLAEMAFTGYGSYRNTSLRSSPEFTTNGMLAKCWRRIDGKTLLFKSGTGGAANTGNEPYSEFYAYQIAEAIGLRAVPYNLSKWKGRLCSTCELFTSIDISYIAVGRLIQKGGIQAIMKYYESLGEKYYNDICDMFLFDAIICNTDRHYGNFGFLVDNHSNKIIDTAPIFDNGLSLFCYAMSDDITSLDLYAMTRIPATYDNFVRFTKTFITPRQKEMLRHLINFQFRKHPRYNLNSDRLAAIEKFITKRVTDLLIP